MKRSSVQCENIFDQRINNEWPFTTIHNLYESNSYTLTDSDFNDLSSLFKLPIHTFFVAEDYSYNILYLKKKDIKKKYLFTSQTLSYQNEILQKDIGNKNEEDEDRLIQSKGIMFSILR